MAVAKSNSSPSSISLCNCFKVSSLKEPILNSNHTSNFEDRYLLGEQLGWGQFGIIRVCSDRLTGEIFACKSIAKDRLVTQDDLCSVKLEIEIMTKLSGHPNVVELKAVYEEENYVHLVMELCAGGELFHRIEKQGRFSEPQARVLFKHLMEVVMYCHDKGIVHRDLKPENILLATKSSSSPIKLADFGLATYIKPGRNLYGTVGSPFYIAPEVLAGGYNQAADVWSAGVILYILLSGMPPFWGNTKSRIFDAVRAADLKFPSDPWELVSASAKDLISKMLCTDPAQRLTAAQVLDHAWIKECVVPPELLEGEITESAQLDLGSVSFSTQLVSGRRDLSFGFASPLPAISHVGNSPAFTCKSSFSSFLAEATPCTAVSVGFSFRSCDGSNSVEFSSPIPTMPSFTFFSPGSQSKKQNQLVSQTSRSVIDLTQRDTQAARKRRKKHSSNAGGLGILFTSLDSSSCFEQEMRHTEDKVFEGRRGLGGAAFKLGIHGPKRNQTIGLGEKEQLDLMVTESVIRWASCTHLSCAPSLRSSLVC